MDLLQLLNVVKGLVQIDVTPLLAPAGDVLGNISLQVPHAYVNNEVPVLIDSRTSIVISSYLPIIGISHPSVSSSTDLRPGASRGQSLVWDPLQYPGHGHARPVSTAGLQHTVVRLSRTAMGCGDNSGVSP